MNTTTRIAILAVAILALPGLSGAGWAQDYKHQGLEFTYPDTWKTTIDRDMDGMRLVRMESAAGVAVVLSATFDGPEADDAFRKRPGLAAFSFGFAPAKKGAGVTDGAATFISFGKVALRDALASSCRFIVPVPGGKKFVSYDSLVHSDGKTLLFGLVESRGVQGEISEVDAFHKAIGEAYDLLGTVTVKGK